LLLYLQIPCDCAAKHVREFLGLIRKAQFHLMYLVSLYSFLYSAVSDTDLYYEFFCFYLPLVRRFARYISSRKFLVKFMVTCAIG